MNLRHIEVFHAIMLSSSMTEAARRLGVSQPSISAVLKYAEQRLGIELFHRVGGRLRPTPEALALFPDVEQIFGRLAALERSIQGLRDANAGVISIAATSTLANVLLPSAISSFRAERPHVRFIVNVRQTAQILTWIRDGGCDLGLIYEMNGVLPENFVVEPVGSFRIACVIPRGHRLEAKTAITPADLVDLPLITFRPDSPLGSRIARAFQQAGVAFDIAIESSTTSTSLLLVANGAGVALVDAAGATGVGHPDLVVKDFMPLSDSPVLLVHARDRPISLVATAFARHLAEVVGNIANATNPGRKTRGAARASTRGTALISAR